MEGLGGTSIGCCGRQHLAPPRPLRRAPSLDGASEAPTKPDATPRPYTYVLYSSHRDGCRSYGQMSGLYGRPESNIRWLVTRLLGVAAARACSVVAPLNAIYVP